MRFKTETKMRIQALKYRDGLENHQIAREMGISQTMIWQYVESLEKQIKKGEITVADIVSSCNALKIEGPKKVKAKEAADKLADGIAKAGLTADELAKNANEIGEALSKAGEVDITFDEISATQEQVSEGFQSFASGGIVKPIKGHEPDSGKEMATPIKRNYGGRPKMVVEVDGAPINIKKPAKQSDYVLTIMGHIYDELVAGKLALKYYLMENGVHELQFVEVRKK